MKTVGILVAVLMIFGTSEAENVCEPDPFVKLNAVPVCFGARDNQFGSFEVSTGGNVIKIKLVHLYGYVTCASNGNDPNVWSHWGCGYFDNGGDHRDYSIVSLTDASNAVLFPPHQLGRGPYNWVLIPGYSSRSPELVMSVYDAPVNINPGQVLRLWYIEDLDDNTEGDNAGRVCADVFGYFV